MTLSEACQSAGKKVLYSTRPGECDLGVLEYVRNELVFVRFGTSVFPVACYPEDLTVMRGASVQEHFMLELRDARIPGLTLED